MLSVNGRSSGFARWSGADRAMKIDQGWFARWSRAVRAIIIDQGWFDRWFINNRAMMLNHGVNAQGQIRVRFDMRKVRYAQGMAVRARADAMAGWGTADGEECSRQLILGSGFKTADLVRESKRRFELVERLIAIECSRDFLCYLSPFLRPSASSLRFPILLHDVTIWSI